MPTDPTIPIQRRSFLKSIVATAAASTLPSHIHALAQAPLASTHTAPPILLNQLGYLPNHAKLATILAHQTNQPPSTFRVLSQDHHPVFQGHLSTPTLDAASGDTTTQADFSALTTPGTYQLEVANTLSDPFTISPTVYAEALRLTMRGYYGQRCGCDVDLGNGYHHPACHLDGAFDPTSGRSGSVPNTGGWHDAGDYGRYIVNSGITTGTLLWAWELYPDSLRNLSLNIPESGAASRNSKSPLPDYLAEIKWNLNWMLSLQDTDGGVWHKQTSLHFCAFIMPQDDHLPSQIIGTGSAPYKSTCATADFAAVMAIAARCYQPFDPAFAARCLTAARNAWTWSRKHPNVTFTNPPTVSTGDYGDNDCSDELLWASAELFRTTREPQYESALRESIKPLLPNPKITAPSWATVDSLGLWTYALTPRDKFNPIVESIQQATQTAATELIARTHTSGYGNSLSLDDYHWGSNSNAGNQSLLLLIANHFQPNPATLNAALSNLHYLLGRNCFGVSWVTQLGHRPFQHPHHRPSASDGIAAPWPGLLSGGPNAHGGDAVADALPKAPPMRMWLDDQRAYSMNEIAINWNAPLVFLLAAANSKRA